MPFRERRPSETAKRTTFRRRLGETNNRHVPDRYHTFGEDKPESMLITEGNGRFIAMNASARRMLGYSRKDLPELDLDSIGARTVRDRLIDVRKIGRARVEGSARNKDGRRFRAVFHTAAMGDGSFQFVLDEIKAREPGGVLLFEDAPLPIIEVNRRPGGISIENINRQARILCGGGEVEDFLGQSVSGLLGLSDQEMVERLAEAQGGRGFFDLAWSTKDLREEKRCFKLLAAPLGPSDETGERLLLSFSDITDEKLEAERLAESIKTGSFIFAEAQHRVKNSLSLLSSMLSLQRGALMPNDKCATILREAQLRIQTLAHFHDHLSRTQGEHLNLEMRGYLGDIVKTIKSAYLSGVKPIQIETELAELELDAKRAATLGLIVNELLTNSLKYAFTARPSGTVRVSTEKSEGRLRLEISDDGTGLPPGFDWRSSKGLGLQFIDRLSQQLLATVEVESKNGFRFSLSLEI
jgi:PAS domain S-box-containing protein